jgi:DNA helicase HerA-like ATPase
MIQPFLVAQSDRPILFHPRMANRHGLVAGATGTGKTVTLAMLAENFSMLGIPVFLADVKGDLSGLAMRPETPSASIAERARKLGLTDFAPSAFPVTFWDVYGENGHPVRATISEMGPLLLSRLLSLNDTQEGVLGMLFRIADDNGLLLLDLKDLRAMARYVGENASSFTKQYGNVSSASVGAIQRNLLTLEEQGADKFFGEPAMNLDDFLQTAGDGRGMINVLSAERLLQNPRAYAALLLWLLAELFERLPEVGDLEKPKLVFFFDEAHLLFNDIPRALQEKIEQVVRLIRSKGVGIFFVTQNPLDLPQEVAGQLGNRIQHALRAFTPRDQKAVKAAAETFRQNPRIDVETALTQLAVGEALVSLLDETGQPEMVERALIAPPRSRIGAISPPERQRIVQSSILFGTYEKTVDRESASEILAQRAAEKTAATTTTPGAASAPGSFGSILWGSTGPRGGKHEGLVETMAKSAVRTVGSTVGRELIRGVLGSLFGGSRRR